MGDSRRRKELDKKNPNEGKSYTEQISNDDSDKAHEIMSVKVLSYISPNVDCCTEKVPLEYADYARAAGFNTLIIPEPKFQDALEYVSDYVIYFRCGFNKTSQALVRELSSFSRTLFVQGIRTVYYADDLIFTANGSAPLYLALGCDAIIVSTNALRDYLLKEHQVKKPIIVVPTHINLPRIDSLPTFDLIKNDRFKILMTSSGRIGTIMLKEIVAKMNERKEEYDNVEIIIVAAGVAQLRSIINQYRNVRKRYFDLMPLEDFYRICKSVDLIIYPAEPRDLDMYIAPEAQQLWLDCKSEVKYTLAGVAKIPIIASPTQSYKEAIQNGKTGILANTADEFLLYIDILRSDNKYRKELGLAARKDIEERYDIRKRWKEFFEAIQGKRDESNRIKSEGIGVYIPNIDGGPGTFSGVMNNYLPIVSNNKWHVTNDIAGASVAIAIAYIDGEEILLEKDRNPNLKIIHRLDGLPMALRGEIQGEHMSLIQDINKVSDQVIWQSEHCRRFWTPYLDTNRGVIIHNGVDLKVFNPEGSLHPMPDGEIKVLHVNWSLFKHKRLDLLDQIITEAKRNNPYIHFYLIGNYESVDTDVVKGSLQDHSNVTYLGTFPGGDKEGRNMLAAAYRSADVLLFTSEMEGSPNVVLESLGCRTIISFNAKADIVPEICGEYCLPFASPAGFLYHIDTIHNKSIDITTIKQKLGEIAERFSIENCARRYMEILDKLCGN